MVGMVGMVSPAGTFGLALTTVLALSAPLQAKKTSVRLEDLERLSLEELLDVEVTAPTQTTEPLRESPSVVTVVTREEIINSGARDLIDVLHLVPTTPTMPPFQGPRGSGSSGWLTVIRSMERERRDAE